MPPLPLHFASLEMDWNWKEDTLEVTFYYKEPSKFKQICTRLLTNISPLYKKGEIETEDDDDVSQATVVLRRKKLKASQVEWLRDDLKRRFEETVKGNFMSIVKTQSNEGFTIVKWFWTPSADVAHRILVNRAIAERGNTIKRKVVPSKLR